MDTSITTSAVTLAHYHEK